MPQTINMTHLLALDIGDKRVGLALASSNTLLASPLKTIANNQDLINQLKNIINQYAVKTVVVGLPRTLNGQDSHQTTKVRQLVKQLNATLNVNIITQDEALSSVRAEAELNQRGKPYSKADIDQLAASYILEDYISQYIKTNV